MFLENVTRNETAETPAMLSKISKGESFCPKAQGPFLTLLLALSSIQTTGWLPEPAK